MVESSADDGQALTRGLNRPFGAMDEGRGPSLPKDGRSGSQPYSFKKISRGEGEGCRNSREMEVSIMRHQVEQA